MSGQWAAGWYPDPAGRYGTLRWWDGRRWAEATARMPADGTLPAAPAGPVAGPDLLPPLPSDADVLAAGGDERRPAWPWVVAGSVAAGLVLMFLVWPTLRDAVGGPGGSQRPAAGPTPNAAPTNDRVRDAATGLSFQRLGPGWRDIYGAQRPGGTGNAGQQQVTQRGTPIGGDYWAEALLGQLDPSIPYRGPADLPRATRALAAAIAESSLYPPHTRRDVTAGPISVDGREAYRLRFSLSFTDAEGYDAKSESVTVALVNIGEPRPATVYISIPDNRADLLPALDRVFATLTVD